MHASSATGSMKRVLQASVVATTLYVIATLVYGLRAHSLALVSEAGHNASDVLALVLSMVAVHFQGRPADDRRTFGYGRAGVLAAFLNAITLVLLSIWIGYLAVLRLLHPVAVQPGVMMVVATVGVVMNGAIAALLWRQSHDVNIRGAFLHMLGDTLSTAAVIAGGAAIAWTGLQWIDPLLSFAIAALILWSSIGIVRETLNILLEGTPLGLSVRDVRVAMEGVHGVDEVHDLHIWSVNAGVHALASHITVGDVGMAENERILDDVLTVLRDRFRILHATIQFEREGCPTGRGCSGLPEGDVTTHHHGASCSH